MRLRNSLLYLKRINPYALGSDSNPILFKRGI